MAANDQPSVLARFVGRDDTGQEDNRRVAELRVVVDCFGHFAALNVRHADIEKNWIGSELPRGIESLGGVIEFADVVGARALDGQSGHPRGLGVIVDNKNTVFIHESTSSWQCCWAPCAVSRLLSMQ